MKFHKDRLKVCNVPIRNITYTPKVEQEAAYSIQTLMVMASEGKPLPSLKTYQYMDSSTVDLSVPTPVVDDVCSAMELALKDQMYKDSKELWDKERREDELKKSKELEKQAIIDEYVSSQSSSE